MVGSHADLAAVLTRLLRADRLDVEVAHVPAARGTARRARTGVATRIPLIRDETGAVITKAAYWLPPDESAATVRGEATVDDTALFDGEVTGVRIEPTATDAGTAGRRVVVAHAPEALGRGPRRAAGHRRRARGAGRGAGTTTGPPVDVLSTHPGLAARFGSVKP